MRQALASSVSGAAKPAIRWPARAKSAPLYCQQEAHLCASKNEHWAGAAARRARPLVLAISASLGSAALSLDQHLAGGGRIADLNQVEAGADDVACPATWPRGSAPHRRAVGRRWRPQIAAPRQPLRTAKGPYNPGAQGSFHLGRSQAVRQRILVPPCGGSNPPAPANRFKPLTLTSDLLFVRLRHELDESCREIAKTYRVRHATIAG